LKTKNLDKPLSKPQRHIFLTRHEPMEFTKAKHIRSAYRVSALKKISFLIFAIQSQRILPQKKSSGTMDKIDDLATTFAIRKSVAPTFCFHLQASPTR
jgi:hypothetical protein